MNKQLRIGTLALVLGGIATAHHISVGLSHSSGTEILTEIDYLKNGPAVGVPPYHLTTAEVDHHAVFSLADGDNFTLTGPGGQLETITFQTGDFADITHAGVDEVLDVINAKATLAQAHDDNGYLVLNGTQGGSASSLQTIDGVGGPLAKLTFADATVSGSDMIQFDLSIPAGSSVLPLNGHPYVVFVSTTPGTFQLQGQTIPIALDASTSTFLTLSKSNPGLRNFRGRLNATEDSKALFDPALIDTVFGASTPGELYFAYAVFSPDFGAVEYVSNAFTVHIL